MTTTWESEFLADLAEHGQVTRAARAAGVNATTVLRHGREDPEFAAAMKSALQKAPVGSFREIVLP